MSRRDDAIKRASMRWEFVRRNSQYQDAYRKLTLNTDDVIVPSVLMKNIVDGFLKRFYVFPINPGFSYNDIDKELIRLKLQERARIKKVHVIYRKYLGDAWVKKNFACLSYKMYKRNKNKSVLKKLEGFLGKDWRKKIKEIQSYKDKADLEISKAVPLVDASRWQHLQDALFHLQAPQLSVEAFSRYQPCTVVIRSYLTQDQNLEAFRSAKGVSLTDTYVADFDQNPILDKYEGDLSKVTMDLDLSYPTKELVGDMKKEISLWKQLERRYSKQKKERQSLADKDVKRMIRIFDLYKNLKGATYKIIARKVFDSDSADAIQKTRNMFNKARNYIDGKYIQIR